MDIKNKTVWITGASSGIGESLTYAFAKAGAAKIIISGRRQAELERVKNACPSDTKITIQLLDVSKHEELAKIGKEVLEREGTIDILINNAGISQRGTAVDTSLDVDKRIMDIDYFGTVVLTKIVLPKMIEQGNGSLVAISSLSGKLGVPQRSAYSAAKHALHGFFDAVRAENTHLGVKVLLVCPGYIKTDISKNALTADGQKAGKMDANQENGMSSDELADRIVKAVQKEKKEIIVGGIERFGVYIKRFFPNIFYNIMAKRGEKGVF